jgi:translation elongation factor EF-G
MSSPTTGSASPMAAIRTLALVGPAAAGKTSLAEALLVKAGAIGAPAPWSAAPRSATSTRSSARCSTR